MTTYEIINKRHNRSWFG